ncbi:sugar O-acetyltransferase [Capnocytophaga sp. oral taxon 336]|uniref:sugar O-acetyltransferase n=1 Tax=Capnocytophaga sp. oral taxon 336 TaxID=712216 RepID=UPI00034E87D9|nr:sugar O-acetyltransferase [Capnocytophaga sp. oral taxon 336]EPE00514.1 maltose O-acetyltransferase [Capnocytophaga sp. oral taxon 336 str. F0502]
MSQSEKEKMLLGQLYDPNDHILVQERLKASDLLLQINQLPETSEERQKLLQQLLGKYNGDFVIRTPFYCDYGYNISIGKNFFANFHCVMLDAAKIVIGNNVLFAPNVSLFTATHPLEVTQRVQGLEYAHPITIGDNVWIGGNVVINPGVTIGNNVVIGSGSVVTKDIPSDSIAYGNPCRVQQNKTTIN